MPTPKYPVVRTSRYGKVKVYQCANPDKSRENPMFIVVWRTGKYRHRRAFMDPVAAQNFTDVVLKKFETGQAVAETLTGPDAAAFAECEKKLNGVPLMVAVNFYLQHHGGTAFQSKTVPELRDLFIADVTAQGNSERDIETVSSHLKLLAEAMPGPMSAVRPTDIDRFLQSKDCSNRTRKNIRGTLCRFWGWARSKDHIPASAADVAKNSLSYKPERAASPGIFTPEQLSSLLEHIAEPWLPYLAICAWTGIRQSEMLRLDWGAVNLEEKIIVLEARSTKTNRRRVAHMPDNLVRWVESIPEEKRVGPLCPASRPNKYLKNAADLAKIEWVDNGLRHSYISYQMALLRDAGKVAEQCGNSSTEVQSSYKANTTEKEAKKWFAIEPA